MFGPCFSQVLAYYPNPDYDPDLAQERRAERLTRFGVLEVNLLGT